jgi:ABC-type glycerol-3-phosphate transport system substrate-binding protein
MVFGLLTACSGNAKKNESSDGQTSVSGNNDTKAQNKSSDVSEKRDFGTIKCIIPENYSKGKDIGKVAEYIKEKSGVLIEPIYSDTNAGATDKFTLMIAAGEDVDYASVSVNQYYSYLNNGSIMAIDELLDKYGANLNKRVNPNLWGWCKKDGKTYAVPNESIDVPHTVQIRKDWLGAQGLSIPQTIPEFKDTMKKFMTAYNTNPLLLVVDGGFNNFDHSLGGFFLPMGYSWWKNDNGEYLPPEMHPDYKKMLQELNSWYREGIIHPETFSANHNQLIEANKIGARSGWYSGTFGGLFNLIKQVPEAEYVFVQPLSGAYDNGYMKKEVPGSYKVVSANSKNPEGVVALLDWIAAELENTIVSRQGIPGVHWEYKDQGKGIIEPKTFDLDDTRYVVGSFEFLDINGFTERLDATKPSAIRTKWYYDYWDIVFAEQVKKTYVPIDMKLFISDSMLGGASEVLNDVNTAMEEAKVSFIMGARPISEWESFLEEWKNIGMKQIIEEKNKLYK